MHYFFRGPLPDKMFPLKRDMDYWSITKWSPDNMTRGPLETYTVYRQTQSCTCLSPYKPCKHAQWLEYWLALPNRERYYLDDHDNQFHKHPFLPRTEEESK